MKPAGTKLKGLVIRSTGKWYVVEAEDGLIYNCRIVGKFRIKGLKITNPVAVGDEVRLKLEAEEGVASIIGIENRENYVVRQSPRKKHQLHLLAANIDQAFVIMTIVHPKLKQGFIDRFLMMTEPYNIPVQIIFNKSDLYSEADLDLYAYLEEIYEDIGYKCHLVSAKTGEGIEEIRRQLKDKISLIGGQSGVGKSTIINAVEPVLELRTEELSDYSGKGQHTTTFAEMHALSFGGRIIDTPGIKTLAFSHYEPMDVAHNFKEIFEFGKNCKYHDCLHRNEPKCAVKHAIEEDQISELRYLNYLQIVDEIEQQNYWERHSDM